MGNLTLPMKTPLLLLLTLGFLGTGSLGFCAPKSDAKKDAHPAPQFKFDASPLNRSAGSVTSYADIVEPVQNAVVSVYSSKTIRSRVRMDPFMRDFFFGGRTPEREQKVEGLGSGVVVTADGYILTNNHVVEGADSINVSLADGRELEAEVIGADPKTDVAVIKVDAGKLPFVTIGDSDRIRVGDVVFAVGNPLGIGQTVTMGIVSATGRNNLGILADAGGYENFIQTDAAINQGNSGGALIDAQGRLLGINTAIISSSRGNIGLGFAIPVNQAIAVTRSLIETGSVQRGFLGITSDPDNPGLTPELAESLGLPRDTRGVLVTDVTGDSPAEKAGLARNDVIVAVDKLEIRTIYDLRNAISQKMPGTKITVEYLRDGKKRSVKVELGTLNEVAALGGLLPGVKVERLRDEQRRNLRAPADLDGLLITEVAEDSPYADRLGAGMVIVEINRETVTDVESAARLLQPGRNLLMVFYRGLYRPLPLTVK